MLNVTEAQLGKMSPAIMFAAMGLAPVEEWADLYWKRLETRALLFGRYIPERVEQHHSGKTYRHPPAIKGLISRPLSRGRKILWVTNNIMPTQFFRLVQDWRIIQPNIDLRKVKLPPHDDGGIARELGCSPRNWL